MRPSTYPTSARLAELRDRQAEFVNGANDHDQLVADDLTRELSQKRQQR